MASSNFDEIFASLRRILARHAQSLSVAEDSPKRYCLEGRVGPATLRAWGGKLKKPMIPVAWVEVGQIGRNLKFKLIPSAMSNF
jgi:hypothetical protein